MKYKDSSKALLLLAGALLVLGGCGKSPQSPRQPNQSAPQSQPETPQGAAPKSQAPQSGTSDAPATSSPDSFYFPGHGPSRRDHRPRPRSRHRWISA